MSIAIVVWVLAVWFLSLALFVTLMAARERVEHPRPSKRGQPGEHRSRWPPAA